MKNLLLICIIGLVITLSSCVKKNCMECSGCNTLTDTSFCEEDFENTNEFNDQIEIYTMDGCACVNKK